MKTAITYQLIHHRLLITFPLPLTGRHSKIAQHSSTPSLHLRRSAFLLKTSITISAYGPLGTFNKVTRTRCTITLTIFSQASTTYPTAIFRGLHSTSGTTARLTLTHLHGCMTHIRYMRGIPSLFSVNSCLTRTSPVASTTYPMKPINRMGPRLGPTSFLVAGHGNKQ